jgi:hypothetical protein
MTLYIFKLDCKKHCLGKDEVTEDLVKHLREKGIIVEEEE